jgi:protein gp37
MNQTKIQYCDYTYNPLTGCSPDFPCWSYCWARKMAARMAQMPNVKHRERYAGFRPAFWPERLAEPLKVTKPKRIAVSFMGDMFQQDVHRDALLAVFGIMSMCGQHTFMVLTKRPARMTEFFATATLDECQAHLIASDWWCDVRPDMTPCKKSRIRDGRAINGTHKGLGDGNYWPLPNVWLGTTITNQDEAAERIPPLLKCPAAVRWVSIEPMQGPIDLTRIQSDTQWPGKAGPSKINALRGYTYSKRERFVLNGIVEEKGELDYVDTLDQPQIDWVVVGGGPTPMDPDWARSVRDQCGAAGVPFYFKQGSRDWPNFQHYNLYPEDLQIREFPKAE